LTLFSDAFVEVLAAQQTNRVGRLVPLALARRRSPEPRFVENDPSRDLLVLSGDQPLPHGFFASWWRTHRDSGAPTLPPSAVVPGDARPGRAVGVVRLDDQRRITQLVEKAAVRCGTPATADVRLVGLDHQGIAANGREYLANMGIYLFNRPVLFDLLQAQPLAFDLVTEVFARR